MNKVIYCGIEENAEFLLNALSTLGIDIKDYEIFYVDGEAHIEICV